MDREAFDMEAESHGRVRLVDFGAGRGPPKATMLSGVSREAAEAGWVRISPLTKGQ